MPRPRNKENKGLPKRWRKRGGSYYYLVPLDQRSNWDGKTEFKLGRTLTEAYKCWAERLEIIDGAETVAELAERFMLEHLPTTSHANQQQSALALRRLLPVFGNMRPQDIEPTHAYRYFDLQSKASTPHSAKADVSVLKTMLSKAVRWGLIKNNPLIKNVRIEIDSKGSRYIEDWEVDEMMSLDNRSRGVQIIQPYIRLKLMTGLRRGDLLRLTCGQLKHDGFTVELNKTKSSSGKVLRFSRTDQLEEVWQKIMALPPRRIGSAPLFVTRQGKSYIDETGRAGAFNSIWQRFVAKCLKETSISERFDEKGLRTKVGSDQETVAEASRLLGHTNTATTEKSYRASAVQIVPLRIKH